MRPFFYWRAVAFIALMILGVGVYAYERLQQKPTRTPEPAVIHNGATAIIGRSFEGRPIEAYSFGEGDTHLAFVGGIHGGYEWNSILLAYEAIDHFRSYPAEIPAGIRVTIIPNANPDGTFEIIKKEGRFAVSDIPAGDHSAGRFNARGVDLNRNFACKWQPRSSWRGKTVSAGEEPFSEPEARAIRDFVAEEKPDAMIFWHSQANAVYASECEKGILPATRELMNIYADAAKYPKVETFDAYPVTGDAEGWLAAINIPAITVELSSHESVEWERNLAGIRATLAGFPRIQ